MTFVPFLITSAAVRQMYQQPKHSLPEGHNMAGFTVNRAHTLRVYTAKDARACPPFHDSRLD